MKQKSLLSEISEEEKKRKRRTWENPSHWELILLLVPLTGIAFLIHLGSARTEIAARQLTANAIVIAHDAPNHDRYGYRFLQNGKAVTGWAYPHDQTDYSIGQTILVYYDPLNPSENSPSDYRAFGTGYAEFIGGLSVMLIAYVAQFTYRWRAYKRQSTPHG